MSLDRTKLESVRDLDNGGLQARCPACAETGQDRKGEHLRISPEGKFGCCVFPGDRDHRKRIFSLAGSDSNRSAARKEIKVRVAAAVTPIIQTGILGKLSKSVAVINGPDASDGVLAVQTEFQEIRTARTPDPKSEKTVTQDSRTARTGYLQLTRDEVEADPTAIYKLKIKKKIVINA